MNENGSHEEDHLTSGVDLPMKELFWYTAAGVSVILGIALSILFLYGHVNQPTRADRIKMKEANVRRLHGMPLEARDEDVVKRLVKINQEKEQIKELEGQSGCGDIINLVVCIFISLGLGGGGAIFCLIQSEH